MVMNSKGQAAQYAIAFMIAVTVIILALAFAFPVNEGTTNARTAMDCSNSSIDDFTKAGCLVADIGQGGFILGLIALAGGVIAARVIWG